MQHGFLTLLLQSAAGLAVVLALFGLLVWMLKSLQRQRYSKDGGARMQVSNRWAIDSRHSVVELTYGTETYLIGLSPNGMTTIARHDGQTRRSGIHTPSGEPEP